MSAKLEVEKGRKDVSLRAFPPRGKSTEKENAQGGPTGFDTGNTSKQLLLDIVTVWQTMSVNPIAYSYNISVTVTLFHHFGFENVVFCQHFM